MCNNLYIQVLVQNVQLTTNKTKNTNINLTENNLSLAMH